ncbi:hypothetical protein Tco_0628373 [Tanacetum coccineum]|uniref:Uncharacterized protein n=1 Tax=Tanacetum coccineum TaxID=301880 RepID=A0ABQ4WQ53_9ASTR
MDLDTRRRALEGVCNLRLIGSGAYLMCLRPDISLSFYVIELCISFLLYRDSEDFSRYVRENAVYRRVSDIVRCVLAASVPLERVRSNKAVRVFCLVDALFVMVFLRYVALSCLRIIEENDVSAPQYMKRELTAAVVESLVGEVTFGIFGSSV